MAFLFSPHEPIVLVKNTKNSTEKHMEKRGLYKLFYRFQNFEVIVTVPNSGTVSNRKLASIHFKDIILNKIVGLPIKHLIIIPNLDTATLFGSFPAFLYLHQ